MDCPNSDDHLPCSPPSATRTFCLGWFRIFNPSDPGANIRHKAPLRPSEKEHGLDRQEGQASTRVTGGNENHQIFCLGDTIPREDIRLQKAGNGVRFCLFLPPFWNRPYFHVLRYIRSLWLIRVASNAVATSMPVLASVLAFITYSATGHALEPGVIFTSLTLFNLLRMPLMLLRKSIHFHFSSQTNLMLQWRTAASLSTISDAASAISRLYGVFEAELLEKTHTVNPSLDAAIEVKGASFTWDSPPPDGDKGKLGKKSTAGVMQSSESRAKTKAFTAAAEKKRTDDIDEKAKNQEESVFKVQDISMSVPRGQLVVIVGPVGSGKTSLLQGLIGEMRKTDGSIVFGGSVGYCSQSAWIQVRFILRYGFLNEQNSSLFRMRPFARTFASGVPLKKIDTGKRLPTRVYSLISRCCPMAI